MYNNCPCKWHTIYCRQQRWSGSSSKALSSGQCHVIFWL